MSGDDAGSVARRALLDSMGPGAAEQLALAQVRVAWDEVVAAAGLTAGGLQSRVVRVAAGIAHVEASEPMLAQELALRGEALVWAANERMRGRPGATIVLSGVAVSVHRTGANGRI